MPNFLIEWTETEDYEAIIEAETVADVFEIWEQEGADGFDGRNRDGGTIGPRITPYQIPAAH